MRVYDADVLKRRGASRFFIKRQRQAIADMRINFDKIIEDVMTDSSVFQPKSGTLSPPTFLFQFCNLPPIESPNFIFLSHLIPI
jgi:hypothetical protein